ncbi:MAG: DUF1800 family protein [Bacteroidota bacterium]
MASLTPKSGTLGRRLAAHLLRRTTFAHNKDRIDQLAQKTADQAVDEIVVLRNPSIPEPIDPETGQGWINTGTAPRSSTGRLRLYTRIWWMHEAMLDNSIGFKMVFFLHTNFVVSSNAQAAERVFDHLELLRFYRLGNFRQLAEKIVRDEVMLRYLDNTLNNRNNPNENFAREYLELFTIGKGEQIGPDNYTNYTEEDIRQAARLLTGFKTSRNRGDNIDPDTNLPMGRLQFSQHDRDDKTFSDAFQNRTITGAQATEDMPAELTAFVDMIFEQNETARAIVRKLYRYFVSRKITTEIESDIIEPLATTFRDGNYELEPVLKQLLKSVHFYDEDDSDNSDEIIGGLIKSPLELMQGAMGYFNVQVPDPVQSPNDHYVNFYLRSVVNVYLRQSDFSVLAPAVVAGYPAYYQAPEFNRNWFNGSTIIARYSLPEMLLTGRRVLAGGNLGGGVRLDIVEYINTPGNVSNPYIASILVNELLADLLPEMPDADRVDYFLNNIFLDQLPAGDWSYEWDNYVRTSDDSEVRIPLQNLIQAIMYSPEYQLF